MSHPYLIVGAGFAGSVTARELAEAGHAVHIIDRRPHIVHTNSERIFSYLSRFTEWRPYEHRVLGVVDGKTYPFPINRDTLNHLYQLDLGEVDAAAFFEKVRVPKDPVRTSEDVVLNSV